MKLSTKIFIIGLFTIGIGFWIFYNWPAFIGQIVATVFSGIGGGFLGGAVGIRTRFGD